MNFLCHSEIALHISEQAPSLQKQQTGILAGAVLGDFLKGRIKETWDPSLAMGIKLHRKIDAMSNRNVVIQTACNRFPSTMRRLAPILIDIVSDYFLANDWKTYQQASLQIFSTKCYSALASYENVTNKSFSNFLKYMKKKNLLANSANWETIENTTFNVLKRLNKESELIAILKAMENIKPLLSQDFKNFYPPLRHSCVDWALENLPQ